MIERIKEILRVNRLTQKIFCEETGMSKTRLSALLNGKVMGISKPILKAIELKYNINPEWLLTGKGDMYKKNESNLPSSESLEIAKDIDSLPRFYQRYRK